MLQILELDSPAWNTKLCFFLGAGKRAVALLFQVCSACRFESMRSRWVGREGHGSDRAGLVGGCMSGSGTK